MNRWILLWFAILVSGAALANDAKLAPELKQPANGQRVRVIVQYKTLPSSVSKDRIRMGGGFVSGDLALVRSVTATIPLSKLGQLSDDDAVAYISPDRAVRSHLNNVVPAVLANYGWSLGLDGSGVGVAVIDSGIHDVTDLQNNSASRIAYSADFVGGGADDQYGHGTHVAGIIGGNAAYSSCPTCTIQIRGLAPNATLINLRVLDNNGQGSDSTVIAAIQAAVQLKNVYNIRVINLSVGGRCTKATRKTRCARPWRRHGKQES